MASEGLALLLVWCLWRLKATIYGLQWEILEIYVRIKTVSWEAKTKTTSFVIRLLLSFALSLLRPIKHIFLICFQSMESANHRLRLFFGWSPFWSESTLIWNFDLNINESNNNFCFISLLDKYSLTSRPNRSRWIALSTTLERNA